MFIVMYFTLYIFLRYINKKIPQVSSSSVGRPNYEKLIECVESEDPAMFEVYKRIEWHYAPIDSLDNFDKRFERDDSLFNEIKNLITELVLVQPEKRMKLHKAKAKLDEFESNSLSEEYLQHFNNFLLLKESFRSRFCCCSCINYSL